MYDNIYDNVLGVRCIQVVSSLTGQPSDESNLGEPTVTKPILLIIGGAKV